jgi:hypothetical protein
MVDAPSFHDGDPGYQKRAKKAYAVENLSFQSDYSSSGHLIGSESLTLQQILFLNDLLMHGKRVYGLFVRAMPSTDDSAFLEERKGLIGMLEKIELTLENPKLQIIDGKESDIEIDLSSLEK